MSHLPEFKHILAPTDFSDCSRAGVEFALSFAKEHGASLTIAHVRGTPLYPFGFGEGSQPLIEKELDEATAAELEKLIANHSDAGIEIAGVIEHGDVVDGLLRLARDKDVDLIVLASHGHTGIRHIMLGSTAERMVTTAPCPVLVFRNATPSKENG